MSSSSTHSSCSSSPSSSPHSDTLLPHGNNTKGFQDTLSRPNDTLSQPEDALPLRKDTPTNLVDFLPQPKDSAMSSSNRSQYRDVHIFNASDRNITIGGLILTKGVTNANLYTMVKIIIIVTSDFDLRNESGVMIEKDNSPLRPGNYYIDSPQPFTVNDEAPLVHTISLGTGTRIQAFRDAVRLRDRQCVITGEQYLDDDDWTGFEAAHIFPLAYEHYWQTYNYGRWISIASDAGGSINSVQNGLLLESAIHQLFDMYRFSINPDDNYKIISFGRDRKGIAGKHLDQQFLNNPQRPAEQLLRWHFQQAVLVNMKGTGEPIFEHDFPPSSDIVGSILEGPNAAQRMEFELFNRLATQFDLTLEISQ